MSSEPLLGPYTTIEQLGQQLQDAQAENKRLREALEDARDLILDLEPYELLQSDIFTASGMKAANDIMISIDDILGPSDD